MEQKDEEFLKEEWKKCINDMFYFIDNYIKYYDTRKVSGNI